ncbi:MAG TPA: sialidase family protein, partial [Planctomycetaceae bacterium]|nr:sialidase family protein [Planctomycetaceae bacterium]
SWLCFAAPSGAAAFFGHWMHVAAIGLIFVGSWFAEFASNVSEFVRYRPRGGCLLECWTPRENQVRSVELMQDRTSSAWVLTALAFFAVSEQHLAASPRKLASPPSLTKLAEAMVMASLPDGRLIGLLGGQEAIARYSSDGGRTWSGPERLFALPKNMGVWGLHYVLTDRNGELHLFYTTDAKTTGKSFSEMRFDIYQVGSTNGRRSWKPPVLVRKGYHGSMLSAIQLKNGRLILPICYLTSRVWSNRGKGFDAFTDMGRFSSGVVYSDDDGDSWKQSAIELKVASPYIGADGIIEPIALELKDGRTWLLLRTQLGRFFESFSQDGATWTKPTPTSILSSDAPPSLTRLKDGRVVLLWNNCLRFAYAQGGRHVLHAAISEDDGRTWRGYREVACNPFIDEPPARRGDHGVSYTLPTLTKDGEIITPLQVGGTGGMWLLRFDPEWLYETSRKTDFSSGAEGWHHFGTKGVEVVSHPGKPGAKVLQMRKPEADWPSAAVWNFPNGMSGRLRMRLKLNSGFAGVRIGLTDHFSVPFDPEDRFHNLVNMPIGPEGQLGQSALAPAHWHSLELDWNCTKQECRILVDSHLVETLPMQRRSSGVNYVRLSSTGDPTDAAGLLIESVDASVSD